MRFLILSAVILGITMSYFFSSITETILSTNIKKRVEEKRRIENTDNINLYPIGERGIIGVWEEKAEIPITEEVSALPPLPPISQNYILLGIIYGQKTRVAILRAKSGQQEPIYLKEKEEIDGAKIEKIKEKSIIVSRGETKEEIFVFEEDGKSQIQQVQQQAQQGWQNQSIPQFFQQPQFSQQIVPPPPPQGGIREISPGKYEVTREFVDRYIGDFGGLLMNARAIPFIKDGKISGFRLLNITPGSFYDKIGIKSGDVIKKINGVDVSSPESIIKIISDVRNETFFEIEIERDGREQKLSYYVR